MAAEPTVFVVDHDPRLRESMAALIRHAGRPVQAFGSALEFLRHARRDEPGCLVLDLRMNEMTGLELQRELSRRSLRLPVVFIARRGEVTATVGEARVGAVEFLEKPFDAAALLVAVGRALERDAQLRARSDAEAELQVRLARLTPRERDVLRLLLEGAVNKVIARELELSVRTVEVHRARVLAKMGVRNTTQLVKRVGDGGPP